MRNILINIINPISETLAEFLPKHIICIDKGLIHSIEAFDPEVHKYYEDYSESLALPGFIDLHVHLSQYLMRGSYEPDLLPWLSRHVFPAEYLSRDPKVAYELARKFFKALFMAGTTMSVIYTAPFVEACEVAFLAAEKLGVRAMIGMTMMDQNSPKELIMPTEYAFQGSVVLYEKWHDRNPMRDYIFTPRFAPSCSMKLMTETASYASSHHAWIQTHLSENKAEIEMVKELFGLSSYTEVYKKAGLLGSHTILGHAIHLGDDELSLLKESGSKIAHCPDSNFFLKSGEFPMERIESAGIPFGLGSDVGAGTSLNMLHHAKMMNYRQSMKSISPEKALYHITLGNARLLEMDDRIGSLLPGKEADIVILQPPQFTSVTPKSLSELIFFGSEFTVRETIVAGEVKHLA